MRIISWNCQGAFRNKYNILAEYNADIYVIQECEDPRLHDASGYSQFAANHYWAGTLKYKGLGVFAKPGIALEKLPWDNHLLRQFMPIRVNNRFTLLALWACAPYIEEYAIYQDIHIDKYNRDMIIIGDTNSNKSFDDKNNLRLAERRSHISVIENLSQIGLCSAYHTTTKEMQGEESIATFYLHRNKDKPYHIDHCFIEESRIIAYRVLNANDEERDFWLTYSDHIPLILDVHCDGE
jgi:exonuclease III